MKLFRWRWMLVALFACTATAPAAVVTLNPVEDAMVTSGSVATPRATNNYGAAGALSISAAGLPQGEYQSVLKFNLASAKASFDTTYGAGNWTILSVSLRLTAANPNNPIFNASAAGSFSVSFMQNDSWAEGTGTPNLPTTDGVTYSTLPGFITGGDPSLGTFFFAGGTSGAADYTLAVPALFASDLTAGGLTSLRLSAADSSVSYLLNSRTFGTATARPQLSVTAVPEPSTAALAVFSLLSLLWRVRRA